MSSKNFLCQLQKMLQLCFTFASAQRTVRAQLSCLYEFKNHTTGLISSRSHVHSRSCPGCITATSLPTCRSLALPARTRPGHRSQRSLQGEQLSYASKTGTSESPRVLQLGRMVHREMAASSGCQGHDADRDLGGFL